MLTDKQTNTQTDTTENNTTLAARLVITVVSYILQIVCVLRFVDIAARQRLPQIIAIDLHGNVHSRLLVCNSKVMIQKQLSKLLRWAK